VLIAGAGVFSTGEFFVTLGEGIAVPLLVISGVVQAEITKKRSSSSVKQNSREEII
jgi:hypothetical protein